MALAFSAMVAAVVARSVAGGIAAFLVGSILLWTFRRLNIGTDDYL